MHADGTERSGSMLHGCGLGTMRRSPEPHTHPGIRGRFAGAIPIDLP